MNLDLGAENARLERATPEARLQFAVDVFGEDLLFSSSFGAQSAVMLHLWSRIAKHLPVVFIDTGFHFPETLAYRDALVARLDLRLDVVRPKVERAAFLARHGEDVQRRDPEGCCATNKIEPLAERKARARGWASGLRRDQAKTRADLAIVERDGHLVRVHPLATVTAPEVAEYFARHDLPPHPLVGRRYLSIGCAPCTRAIDDGEEERAGRWADLGKTECGLHDRPRRVAS